MKAVFIVCMLSLSILALIPQASACSCAAEWKIENDFEEPGTIIFSGNITNIQELQRTFKVTFEVNQTWKGIPSNVTEMIILTSQTDASCGYYFTPNESYLVVATGKWNQTPDVSICSSTVLLSSAGEELSFLNKNSQQPLDSLLSPLKQFKSGIKNDQIQCGNGLELVIKISNDNPACVKPSSIQKLIERGWTT